MMLVGAGSSCSVMEPGDGRSANRAIRAANTPTRRWRWLVARRTSKTFLAFVPLPFCLLGLPVTQGLIGHDQTRERVVDERCTIPQLSLGRGWSARPAAAAFEEKGGRSAGPLPLPEGWLGRSAELGRRRIKHLGVRVLVKIHHVAAQRVIRLEVQPQRQNLDVPQLVRTTDGWLGGLARTVLTTGEQELAFEGGLGCSPRPFQESGRFFSERGRGGS